MRSNSEAEPKPKEGCGSSKMLLLMACPKYLEAHHRPVERAGRERRTNICATDLPDKTSKDTPTAREERERATDL
jgi:hypothetical protein